MNCDLLAGIGLLLKGIAFDEAGIKLLGINLTSAYGDAATPPPPDAAPTSN